MKPSRHPSLRVTEMIMKAICLHLSKIEQVLIDSNVIWEIRMMKISVLRKTDLGTINTLFYNVKEGKYIGIENIDEKR